MIDNPCYATSVNAANSPQFCLPYVGADEVKRYRLALCVVGLER